MWTMQWFGGKESFRRFISWYWILILDICSLNSSTCVVTCVTNSSFIICVSTIFIIIFFWPLHSIGTRLHCPTTISSEVIVSRVAFSTSSFVSYIFSSFTEVFMSSRLTAFSVNDIFWCSVHRPVSLVIKDVSSTCVGRILQSDVNYCFKPGFSLTNFW